MFNKKKDRRYSHGLIHLKPSFSSLQNHPHESGLRQNRPKEFSTKWFAVGLFWLEWFEVVSDQIIIVMRRLFQLLHRGFRQGKKLVQGVHQIHPKGSG